MKLAFELQDEVVEVCAEAELAWSSCGVLLLLDHQGRVFNAMAIGRLGSDSIQ